jgi:hypothetical protein
MNDTDHVDSLGYPRTELATLLDAAEVQYRENVKEHGPGKNWLRPDAPEARWHIWKSCDELFQARDHVHNGEYEQATRHFADALNHMLMAMERTRHERSVDTATGYSENDTETADNVNEGGQ